MVLLLPLKQKDGMEILLKSSMLILRSRQLKAIIVQFSIH